MCSHDEFIKLTTNFIFLNCKNHQDETAVHELNNLLNELNSQDYQKQKFVDSKTATILVESFTNIPASEDTLVMKSCCLLVTLLNKQKIQLSRETFKKIVDWLLKCLQLNFQGTACEVLSMLQALFKNHSAYCTEYWDTLLSGDGILLNILGNRTDFTASHCGAHSFGEIVHSTIFCIESLLLQSDGPQLTDSLNNLLTTTGTKVLEFLYSKRFKTENTNSFVKYITSAINIIYKVASENQTWCEKNLGSLIGVSKAYIHYGLPEMPEVRPQKVHISQQPISESPIARPSKGGKVAKTKKPRIKQISKLHEQSDQSTHNATLPMDFDNSLLAPFNKTSDSDFSESEAGRVQNERHKQAKLRLSAISLLALIAKDIEKKTLYGYWHSLFPSEPLTHTSTGLLNCVIRDPNPRCRLAALQAASWMFFGSKNYLLQAECSDKAPTSFMPFSISLGNMILSIYNGLTQAISTEISIPVLTQILKCFTVLIQATPFNRLKSGFVSNLVKYIRKLVYHKDATVQVAALRVMEFLISRQDITAEISACVEIPKFSFKSERTNQNKLNDLAIAQLVEPELEEEFFDSDYEEESGEIKDNSSCSSNADNSKMSWLLQIVLENLGVNVDNFKLSCSAAAIPIRIQSLQVLSAMAPHFVLLKDHLDKVAIGMKISLDDSQLEVQLAAGRCLDIIGDSINAYLLELVTPSPDTVMTCKDFWFEILPSVIPKIQDPAQNPALKAVLCDFMSNIGIHVFERLPHSSHIQLISVLSGLASVEDNSVRAAAVRALAVYVLFPSLRGDLCFTENIAEYVIELMKEERLFIRVKTSWAMGNISEVLVASCTDAKLDRISENLFQRLCETAITSASDNDKVRCNAVRTLGNLLRLINADHLESNTWRNICMSAIEKLVQCMKCGNAKVKWNTCFAIGNFMRNSALFEKQKEEEIRKKLQNSSQETSKPSGEHPTHTRNNHRPDAYRDMNWQQLVFPSLCSLIVSSTNFKVRINGSAALRSINVRENYGSHLVTIWVALLTGLEQSDNLLDFNEYKHRDNLQEQLCLTISHIIKIAVPEDFVSLKNKLIPKLEIVIQIWKRVANRILPENAAPLLSCTLELSKLANNADLTSEQRKSVQLLQSCFTQPNVDSLFELMN